MYTYIYTRIYISFMQVLPCSVSLPSFYLKLLSDSISCIIPNFQNFPGGMPKIP